LAFLLFKLRIQPSYRSIPPYNSLKGESITLYTTQAATSNVRRICNTSFNQLNFELCEDVLFLREMRLVNYKEVISKQPRHFSLDLNFSLDLHLDS